MFFKFIILAVVVAVANAGVIGGPLASTYSYSTPVAAPLAYTSPLIKSAPLGYAAPAPFARVSAPLGFAAPIAKVSATEEYDPHPQYSFAYDVQDALTGDNKQQQESRDGDVVQGSYSLVESDGTRRIVQYTADPHNGFNAVVSKEPLAAPVVTKAIAPIAYAAPITKYAAPLSYAAPLAKAVSPYAYSTPYGKIY